VVSDVAGNGVEALNSLKQRQAIDPYELIIMDCHMPEMDGYDTTRAIRRGEAGHLFRNIPIIALTANAMQGDREKCLESGMSDYIAKPVIEATLIKVMCRWLFNDISDNANLLSGANTPPSSPVELQISSVSKSGLSEEEAGIVSGVSLLLVEDNLVNQMVAKAVLKKFGITADEAINGVAALKILKQRDEVDPYQIILMDCQMPDMDGYEATRCIRRGEAGEHYCHIPIIALTANALEGDREKCLASGMSDYLTKPIDKEKLKDSLIHWLLDEEYSGGVAVILQQCSDKLKNGEFDGTEYLSILAQYLDDTSELELLQKQLSEHELKGAENTLYKIASSLQVELRPSQH